MCTSGLKRRGRSVQTLSDMCQVAFTWANERFLSSVLLNCFHFVFCCGYVFFVLFFFLLLLFVNMSPINGKEQAKKEPARKCLCRTFSGLLYENIWFHICWIYLDTACCGVFPFKMHVVFSATGGYAFSVTPVCSQPYHYTLWITAFP